MKKKQPEGHLHGIKFTLLGLGDSNYSTYMGCPRLFRTRCVRVGAGLNYTCMGCPRLFRTQCVGGWVGGGLNYSTYIGCPLLFRTRCGWVGGWEGL